MRHAALRLALGLILLLGAVRATGYLAYAAWRIPCPRGEVWHLEEKMVHLAWRVQAGEELYPEWRDGPHVSNFFGPGYSLVVGGLGRLLRADLAELTRIGRIVTFVSGLAATGIVGVFLGRRAGLEAGAVGALLTLGSAPMFGFSTMVRPDVMAEALGFLGFVLAVGSSRKSRVAGTAVLALAILTKQTSATFALAASLNWLVLGRWRIGTMLLLSVVASVAVVVGVATATVEPRLAESLLGEGGNPPDLTNWAYVLRNLTTRAPDLWVFWALGLGLWAGLRPREASPASLASVIVVAGLALAVKRGSDLNYFLDLRLVEGLAGGTLWRWARSGLRQPRPRMVQLAAVVVAAASLAPGALDAAREAWEARGLAESVESPPGRQVTKVSDRVITLARDPAVRLLTDQALFELHRGPRAEFVDPFLFRMLVEAGRIRPTRMARALSDEEYDLIVVAAPLDDPRYARYPFGLPPVLVEAAKRHYIPIGWRAGFYFYGPRSDPRRAGYP